VRVESSSKIQTKQNPQEEEVGGFTILVMLVFRVWLSPMALLVCVELGDEDFSVTVTPFSAGSVSDRLGFVSRGLMLVCLLRAVRVGDRVRARPAVHSVRAGLQPCLLLLTLFWLR
jgi:hypothetical protein